MSGHISYFCRITKCFKILHARSPSGVTAAFVARSVRDIAGFAQGILYCLCGWIRKGTTEDTFPCCNSIVMTSNTTQPGLVITCN